MRSIGLLGLNRVQLLPSTSVRIFCNIPKHSSPFSNILEYSKIFFIFQRSPGECSDWNWFRTNPKISELFRNLYPNQTVLFRSNPKKFLQVNLSEAHSKSLRTYNPNASVLTELIRINPKLSIRMNPVNPNQSEWKRIFWNHSDWFG